MNLIVFDIDGTIVDSVKADDECFIQSFKDLHGIDLTGADWNNFKHVTDSGLCQEIFDGYMNRKPIEKEIIDLKIHFYNLLDRRRTEITPIKGAIDTLEILKEQVDTCIGFATGGWKETAELKLSTIKFEIGDLILTSANEHINRAAIIKLAIEKSLDLKQLADFDSITYVGDGLWDLRATKVLGINFIGVDSKQSNVLTEAGAKRVLHDLSNTDKILEWVTGNQ